VKRQRFKNMTPELITLIRDISGIGALVVFIIAMLPVFKALGKLLEAKLNKNIPYDVQEGIKQIEKNHLNELQKSSDRIERKLEKLDNIENILIEIKATLNKGR